MVVIAGAPNPTGWSFPSPPITVPATVSVTVIVVIVAPPVFVTTIRYVIPWPTPGFDGLCVLLTVNANAGAGSVKLVGFVIVVVSPHPVASVTNAVLLTSACAHTSPVAPVIVNVYEVPGVIMIAAALHAYRVPDATPTITGATNGAPWSATWFTNCGPTVSVTVTVVAVAVPTFVTTIRYVTGVPAVRFPPAGICVLLTVNATVAGVTVNPTAFVISVVAPGHADSPTTYPVFDIHVAAHTPATAPVIVNVYVAPGRKLRLDADQSYRVPVAATLVAVAAANAEGWSVTTPVSTVVSPGNPTLTVSVTSTRVSVADPEFVTSIFHVTGVDAVSADPVAGVCVFLTSRFVTGGPTIVPVVPTVSPLPAEHGVATSMYAVFDSGVTAHTSPTAPVIVNVIDVFG